MLNVPLKCPSSEEYGSQRDNGDKLFVLVWINGSSGLHLFLFKKMLNYQLERLSFVRIGTLRSNEATATRT